MKTSRITLTRWISHELYLDVDWPAVQRTVGTAQLQWLLRQPPEHCQLVLDQQYPYHSLVAEFYTAAALAAYQAQWSTGSASVPA